MSESFPEPVKDNKAEGASEQLKFEVVARSLMKLPTARETPINNEDAFLSLPEKGIYAVFDGMGGRENGEAASKAARDALENLANEEFASIKSVEGVKAWLEKNMIVLDRAVKEKGRQLANNELGTTAVITVIWKSPEGKTYVVGANEGDSRAYVKTAQGELIKISKDQRHDFGESPEENEKIDKFLDEFVEIPEDLPTNMMEAAVHRATLSGVLGVGYAFPELFSREVLEGDMIILTSDGVHDNLTTEEIRQTNDAAELVEAARARSLQNRKLRSKYGLEEHLRAKNDDTTAISIKIAKPDASETESWYPSYQPGQAILLKTGDKKIDGEWNIISVSRKEKNYVIQRYGIDQKEGDDPDQTTQVIPVTRIATEDQMERIIKGGALTDKDLRDLIV